MAFLVSAKPEGQAEEKTNVRNCCFPAMKEKMPQRQSNSYTIKDGTKSPPQMANTFPYILIDFFKTKNKNIKNKAAQQEISEIAFFAQKVPIGRQPRGPRLTYFHRTFRKNSRNTKKKQDCSTSNNRKCEMTHL